MYSSLKRPFLSNGHGIEGRTVAPLTDSSALILFKISALYKSFTYLFTYLLTYPVFKNVLRFLLTARFYVLTFFTFFTFFFKNVVGKTAYTYCKITN